MAITSIERYFVGNPNLVSIITTDNLETITGTNYLVTQAANIEEYNKGPFEWADTDMVIMGYSPSLVNLFTRDAANNTFVELSGGLSQQLTNGHIYVGNPSNIAADVAMGGDIGIDNAGNTFIQDFVVTNNKIQTSTISFDKLNEVADAQILVGFPNEAGTHLNPSTVSGDATLDHNGALTVSNNAITAAKIANNAVTSDKLDASVLQYIKVPITSAEFKDILSNPKPILIEPSSTEFYIVEKFALVMTFNSVAYQSGSQVALQFANFSQSSSVKVGTIAPSDFYETNSSIYQPSINATGSLIFDDLVAQGLYLTSAITNFTTGNSAFVMHVWYRVVSIT